MERIDKAEIKNLRTRNLRYKKPALASFGYDAIATEMWEIIGAIEDVQWFLDDGDETLLNALDGDNEAEWEFRMAFADLAAKRISSANCGMSWWTSRRSTTTPSR